MIPTHRDGRLHVGVLFQEASDQCTDKCGTGTVCFEHMTSRLKEVADLLREKELQNGELREIVRWFANALEMKTDKLGRVWSFGYWEGADPGLALVNGGEKGIENSRFNAALKLESGELGVILAVCREKTIPEKPVDDSPFPTARELGIHREINKFLGGCEAHHLADCRTCAEKRKDEGHCDCKFHGKIVDGVCDECGLRY